MSLEQANQFLADYGAIILFFALLFAMIGVLVKLWPVITGFVITINILLALPGWQDKQVKWQVTLGERLDGSDARLSDLETLVAKIDHQVHPNGGGSLNDQVAKAQGGVDQIRAALGLIND